MPFTLTTVTPPDGEPLTLQEVKDFLRVDGTDQDSVINLGLSTARALVEVSARRQLMPATLRRSLDRFPCGRFNEPGEIELPRPPAVAVESITYIDTAGEEQTLDADAYRVDVDSEPARITPAYGTTWPATLRVTNAVKVTYTAGYSDAAAIPPQAKQAMMLLVSTWYENRETVVVGTVAAPVEVAFKAIIASITTPWLPEE